MCQVLVRFAEGIINRCSTKAQETLNSKQLSVFMGIACGVFWVWGHAGKEKRNLVLKKLSLELLVFVTSLAR